MPMFTPNALLEILEKYLQLSCQRRLASSNDVLDASLRWHDKKNYPQASRYWVAYSGGLDSHVLLQAMASLRDKFTNQILEAVHINHSLSPNAKDWQNHCELVCKKLHIPLKTIVINATASQGQSREAVARTLRYEALKDLLQEHDHLLSAHHLDDQAETVLLQLFRGAGPKGLAAMPKIKPFGRGFLLRPLLQFTRTDLQQYAQENHLRWIDDESNFDISFDRNFIRHQLMPVIKKRWPSVATILNRVAEHCGENQILVEQLAKMDLLRLKGSQPQTLSINQLLNLDVARRNNVIRYWLQRLDLPLPDTKKLTHLTQNVLCAAQDATPKLSWSGAEIRRYRDNLYATGPLKKFDSSIIIDWPILKKPSLKLPDEVGVVTAKKAKGRGVLINKNDKVQIRFRQGGELCQPLARHETHQLKKLLQEWGVPPWQRDHIPLLYINDQLASVIGFCICESFAASKEQQGWVIKPSSFS